MGAFVTFGEAMLRMSPLGQKRLRQAMGGQLEVGPAGAELNVAASLSLLGRESRYVTALPENPLADALIGVIADLGVETRHIVRGPGRLGLVFVESGANQRPSRVVYDRKNSTLSLTPADAYDWEQIFSGAAHLHITGITPALSKTAASATLAATEQARRRGLSVSCDLNFRSKLWQWDAGKSTRQLSHEVMSGILPDVDLLIANETDLGDVFDLHVDSENLGRFDLDAYPGLVRQLVERFPNLQRVAITLRESLSASHNNWGAMLYDVATDRVYSAPQSAEGYQPYEICSIVDRVGTGDAFVAGLLFALSSGKYSEMDRAVAFATAASCLAHSFAGDINYTQLAEIEALLAGNTSGRVVR
jgi:2-dehydro-3-deoxygluconokinase